MDRLTGTQDSIIEHLRPKQFRRQDHLRPVQLNGAAMDRIFSAGPSSGRK
jgi:hypothetical protein